ncbi:MAG: MBL fold metallo-hydrolase [Alphaproteobacteria bacterium]|nr:MBL fold metallo-hydrolase [Alphaproteobacteria bacterium]
MARTFASQGDLEEKQVTFAELADGLYAYTAEGDPNAGVIVGDDAVMIVDTLATPVQAQALIEEIHKVTDKPISYIVLSHYHAVRVLGASAYGAEHIICSQGTYELIQERGEQDFKSEVQRFPRLFQSVESVPGLTWPTMVIENKLTMFLGEREVQIMHLGKGHTKGDTVVWLPKEKVLFSGDQVEWGATPYCGDAHLTEWPESLEKLKALGPEKLVPGRGEALKTAADSAAAIESTQGFVRMLLAEVGKGATAGRELGDVYEETFAAMAPKYGEWVIFEHCMPFNVSRAYDESKGIDHPRIWTEERDIEMWKSLEG